MRRLRIGVLVVVLTSMSSHAWAFVVFDPLAFAQNTFIASTAKMLASTSTLIDDQIRRAARRFWIFVDARKYQLLGQPLWRTRRVDPALPQTVAFMDAVNGGDSAGTLVDQALVPRDAVTGLPMTAALNETLASLDMLDSAIKEAIDQVGRIRGNRKAMLQGVAALETDTLATVDSTTHVADVIAAGTLLGARQGQERAEILTVLNDLLLSETKQQRDVHALDVRMRMERRTVDVADGATTDLTTWRMP